MKREHAIIIATIVAVFILFGASRMVARSYKIPTNAMAPTLRIGDRILVNMMIY